MELTQNEKKILTLLDETQVKGFEEFAQKFISLSKNKIQEIVNKFKDLKLIDIISLSEKKNLFYFHNRLKVKPDMLDDDLRYKIDYGSDSPILVSSEKIKKNIKSK
jgi:hypothetical protein